MAAFDDTRECCVTIHYVTRRSVFSGTYKAKDNEDEIDRLFEKLSQGGAVFMPLTAYPFSDKFGWVADKYGVSWQLNLERN